MDVTFDLAKDDANIAKHGVSLSLASEMVLEDALIVVDGRRDYGEPRFNAYGLIDEKLFAMTFTYRGETVRVISLRRCHAKELRRYTE